MKTIRNIMIFSAVCLCLALSARFLNHNTVFAPENFKKDKESARKRFGNDTQQTRPNIPFSTTNSTVVPHNGTSSDSNPNPIPTPPKNDTPIPTPPKNDTPIPTPPKNDTPTPTPIPHPCNNQSSNDSYNINYDCPEGERFDTKTGRCAISNTTQVMFTNKPTSTKTNILPNNLITPTIVDKLNITQHYVDRKASQVKNNK